MNQPNPAFSGHGSCPFVKNDGPAIILGALELVIPRHPKRFPVLSLFPLGRGSVSPPGRQLRQPLTFSFHPKWAEEIEYFSSFLECRLQFSIIGSGVSQS
jgi:hypothetical protein